ncbi:MAG: T9SS type A sorting domain-containing protein [Bacteroidetes bacterium]|nr:T9SS type A sorting domain-containing protein [Bacteroidota bacterium]
MKKTFLFIGFWFASIVLTAQNLISLKLGSTDITYLAPGDTVYVPIICNEIGPSNIITGAQYTFEMDPSVIYWTGNFTSNFGNPEDWMFFYSGDQMIASSGYGIAINGMTLISFEFIYTGGETPLTWGYTEVFDETFEYYSVTVVGPSCVCDLPDYAVTFHVTAYGEDLEGAIITIGNLWLETDENGMATFNLCDGQYDYTVTKPGYADEEGTFTVAGASVQVEVEMEECWEVSFSCPANCENDFNGWRCQINGEVLQSGESIYLPNGTYSIFISWLGCFGVMGAIVISNVSVSIGCSPGLINPVATFHIQSQAGNLEGAIVVVDTFSLITNNSGETGFCLPGGLHYFSVTKDGFDTLSGTFTWSNYCEDTTLNMLMNPVSVEKNMTGNFRFYPNPSTGKFYLELPSSATASIEIRVMDLTGRQVLEEKATTTGKREIDLANKPKGIYFVRLKAGDMVMNKKVIIQ